MECSSLEMQLFLVQAAAGRSVLATMIDGLPYTFTFVLTICSFLAGTRESFRTKKLCSVSFPLVCPVHVDNQVSRRGLL